VVTPVREPRRALVVGALALVAASVAVVLAAPVRADAAGGGAGAAPSCQAGALTVTAIASPGGAVAAQTTVVYDVAVTDGDGGGCAPRRLLFLRPAPPAGFAVFVTPFAAEIAPGGTAHFTLSVTGSTAAVPGAYVLSAALADLATGAQTAASVTYTMAPLSGCFVRPDRELVVRDVSVVDDPVRTSPAPAGSADRRAGAWTFGRLMTDLAPAGAAPAAFVERFFETWLSDQPVGGFTVAARRSMQAFLLDAWPRGGDGLLDLSRAPLRLLAIVNRMDVRSLADHHAGQGRFVFGVLDRNGLPAPFTLILEYRLPAACPAAVLAWARAWHQLGALPFPGEAYNAALQAVTDRFTARGADPSAPGGSALAAVRSDEAALTFTWELRQFSLAAADGFLQEVPVDLTPDSGFIDGSPVLADFINTDDQAIRAGRDVVPASFDGVPFQGGASINLLQAWNAPGIADAEARHLFSLNTCSGCHGAAETGTGFLHVAPRAAGEAAALSGFLQGIALPDPFTGELRTFNDLGRRKGDLEGLVCTCAGNAAAGIARAH
jgi:hypothetical protein